MQGDLQKKARSFAKGKEKSAEWRFFSSLGIRRVGYGSIPNGALALIGAVPVTLAFLSDLFIDLTVDDLIEQADDTEGGGKHTDKIADCFKESVHIIHPFPWLLLLYHTCSLNARSIFFKKTKKTLAFSERLCYNNIRVICIQKNYR